MKFPRPALDAIEKLNEKGHQAYLVGGALRDALQGKPLGDIDLATSALPEDLSQVFPGEKLIPTGLEHGTMTLIYKGLTMEITTFRTEGSYRDHRRPSSVSFTTSLKEDVKRRDFTINALAYHPEEGLIDHVGGLKDLEKGILRAVGNPQERFSEDALRMVRAIRFVSVLGFELEEETEKALFDKRLLIQKVSGPRLQQELNKLLLGDWVEEVLVCYYEIIAIFIPEIIPMIGFEQRTPYHCYDVWTHTAKVVAFSKRNLVHRLAALFHDIAKPQTFYIDDRDVGHFPGHCIASEKVAREILTRLGYSRAIQRQVLPIILHHNTSIRVDDMSIPQNIYYWGPEVFFEVIDFKYADNLAKEPAFIRSKSAYDDVRNRAKAYLAGQPLLSHKDLDITSQDLMDLGIKGKELGQTLEKLALAVFAGIDNKKAALLNHLRSS